MDTTIRTKQVEKLKEILAQPTYFRDEHIFLQYLINYLTEKNYYFYMDNYGNIYIEKGDAEYYPMVCAHTDTVHRPKHVDIIDITPESTGQQIIIGWDSERNVQNGIGADDKAGVFICLELLEKMPVLKVVLFASEEQGCIGSRHSDLNFFTNVGYVMEFDCPGNSDITEICNGVQLFNPTGEFFSKIAPIFIENMPEMYTLHDHPYTDIWAMKLYTNVECINIATGYERLHSPQEYAVVDDVLRAIYMGEEIINTLGLKLYEDSTKQILTEDISKLQKKLTNRSGFGDDNYKTILSLLPEKNLIQTI